MLKPKMVFTVLATWFAFHLIIFWILNPMGVDAIIADAKGQFMARMMGYIGGFLSLILAYVFFMIKDIENGIAKKILLGVGSIMVIADGIIIASNMSITEKFPNDTMMATPAPAVALWILLTVYTLYVAVTTE